MVSVRFWDCLNDRRLLFLSILARVVVNLLHSYTNVYFAFGRLFYRNSVEFPLHIVVGDLLKIYVPLLVPKGFPRFLLYF